MDDLFEARAARDEALDRVTSNAGSDWMAAGLLEISRLSNWEGTAEDLRLLFLDRGFHQPHHHNAWGGLIRTAIGRGLLLRTGRFTNMRTRKSHARMTAVYKSR